MKSHASTSKSPRISACVDYWFRQHFRVPPEKAFRWCIDFEPYEWGTNGAHGSRKVTWVGPRTVILDDQHPAPGGRRVRKVRMVQVYPETRTWVSTHVAGPNIHSQFRYAIVPDGPGESALVFHERELRWGGAPLSSAAVRRLAKRLRASDSGMWKEFAAQMERDVRSG